MNLNEKTGQLFMVGFDGTEVNGHIRRMILEYRVGGVILFRRNVGTPQQLADWLKVQEPIWVPVLQAAGIKPE